MSVTRDTFDALKHYVGVRLQQGVPLVDADWNEQEDIRKYELRAFLKWFVGNGIPKGNDGFRVVAIPAENDFYITGGDGTAEGAGRCLVEGWDVMNENRITYSEQGLEILNPPQNGTRTDTVYLDVWERELDHIDDGNLVNPDIGIPTCTRFKREWLVRVAEGKEPDELDPPPDGHVYYPLAKLSRPAGQPLILNDHIEDLRQTNLTLSDIKMEIMDARGIKGNLGNRLDESLTKGGQLRKGVVGNEHIKEDADIAEKKVRYDKILGHSHDGEHSRKIRASNLYGVQPCVNEGNLILLTKGPDSDASNLHHHLAIPEQERRYSVPITKPFQYEDMLEFTGYYQYIKAEKNTMPKGFLPVYLPHGSKTLRMGIYTSCEASEFNLNVEFKRVQNNAGGHLNLKQIQITSSGWKEESVTHIINSNDYYYIISLWLWIPLPSEPLFIDGIYIDYEVTKLV